MIIGSSGTGWRRRNRAKTSATMMPQGMRCQMIAFGMALVFLGDGESIEIDQIPKDCFRLVSLKGRGAVAVP